MDERAARPHPLRRRGLVNRGLAVDSRARRSDHVPDLDRACGGRVGLCERASWHVALVGSAPWVSRGRLRRHRGGGHVAAGLGKQPGQLVPGHLKVGDRGLPGSDLAASGADAPVRALLPGPGNCGLGNGTGRRVRRLRLPPLCERRAAARRRADRQHVPDSPGSVRGARRLLFGGAGSPSAGPCRRRTVQLAAPSHLAGP